MEDELLPQGFHPFLKRVPVPETSIFYGYLIIIYGAYGVVQHGGYFLAVIHAQKDEGEHPLLRFRVRAVRRVKCL